MDQVLTQTKFDILRTRLNPTELPISEASKEKAEDLLAKSDFPTRKNEAWKYTNVNGLNKLLLDGESSGFMKPHNITKSADKVYIVNGQVAKDQITNLNRALQINEDSKLEARNLYDKHQKYFT